MTDDLNPFAAPAEDSPLRALPAAAPTTRPASQVLDRHRSLAHETFVMTELATQRQVGVRRRRRPVGWAAACPTLGAAVTTLGLAAGTAMLLDANADRGDVGLVVFFTLFALTLLWWLDATIQHQSGKLLEVGAQDGRPPATCVRIQPPPAGAADGFLLTDGDTAFRFLRNHDRWWATDTADRTLLRIIRRPPPVASVREALFGGRGFVQFDVEPTGGGEPAVLEIDRRQFVPRRALVFGSPPLPPRVLACLATLVGQDACDELR